MKISVINSNSKGNGYILTADTGEILLIEAGVKFSEIKKALNFELHLVDCLICTHEHKDHSKSLSDVIAAGIPTIATKGTYEACKIDHTNEFVIQHGQRITFNNWKISAFQADHDAKEPVGFIVEHGEDFRLLFLTDSYKLRYKLGAFNYVMIEANYCENIVEKLRQGKKYNSFLEKRRLRSHMSFQTAINTLQSFDLSKCSGIMLLHLSDLMTDEYGFIKEVESLFGIPTVCAYPELEISLPKF